MIPIHLNFLALPLALAGAPFQEPAEPATAEEAAAAPDFAALPVLVGKATYELPASDAPGDAEWERPPIHDDTLAAIERWRAFAWHPLRKSYRYRFAVAPGTSTVVLLTPYGSGGETAAHLDRTAAWLREVLGDEHVPHDFVAVLCVSRGEYERAADFAVADQRRLGMDAMTEAYVEGAWLQQARRSPTFFQPFTGVTGVVQTNSEMWDPDHELVRGFAQTAVLRHARYLTHFNPLMVGLSWNAEYDVLGDILSIPYFVGFQPEDGRGKWKPGVLAKVLERVEREIEYSGEERTPTMADLPYLGRGDGLPEDRASIAWAVSRHLARHHTAELPALLTAISERVPEIHTVTHADGSTEFSLQPGYAIPWSEVWAQWQEVIPACDWEHLEECIAKRCKHCRSWAKERDLHD